MPAEVAALAAGALAPGSKASASMAFTPGLRRLKLQLQEALASGARALAREAGAHVRASTVEVPNGRARGGFSPPLRLVYIYIYIYIQLPTAKVATALAESLERGTVAAAQESKIDPKVISWNIPSTPQSSVFDGLHSVSARSTERAKGHAGRDDKL